MAKLNSVNRVVIEALTEIHDMIPGSRNQMGKMFYIGQRLPYGLCFGSLVREELIPHSSKLIDRVFQEDISLQDKKDKVQPAFDIRDTMLAFMTHMSIQDMIDTEILLSYKS
jgi:hypothetical protein